MIMIMMIHEYIIYFMLLEKCCFFYWHSIHSSKICKVTIIISNNQYTTLYIVFPLSLSSLSLSLSLSHPFISHAPLAKEYYLACVQEPTDVRQCARIPKNDNTHNSLLKSTFLFHVNYSWTYFICNVLLATIWFLRTTGILFLLHNTKNTMSKQTYTKNSTFWPLHSWLFWLGFLYANLLIVVWSKRQYQIINL